MTVAPAVSAISRVASAEPPSHTITSETSPSIAASKMDCKTAGKVASALIAGMMTEIIAYPTSRKENSQNVL